MRTASRLVALCAGVAAASIPAVARAQQAGEDGVAVDVPQGDAYSDTDPSALTDFRGALDPYGNWVDDPAYGTAWTPDPAAVGPDFVPYDSSGRWDYLNEDYSWISDYVWGAVCFHYGRWVLSAGRWLWIPGRQYAGAWVDWRLGEEGTGLLGWSPAPPAWIWVGGGAVSVGFASPQPWTFAPATSIFTPFMPGLASTGDAALPFLSRSRPYVRARRAPAGEVGLSPVLSGPHPSSFGIDVARIAHAAPSPAELRARQLARPSTAIALGARAPTPHVVFRRPPAVLRGAPGPRAMPRGRR